MKSNKDFCFYLKNDGFCISIMKVKTKDKKICDVESYHYYEASELTDSLIIKTNKFVKTEFLQEEIEGYEKVDKEKYQPVFDKVKTSYIEMNKKINDIKTEYHNKIKEYITK